MMARNAEISGGKVELLPLVEEQKFLTRHRGVPELCIVADLHVTLLPGRTGRGVEDDVVVVSSVNQQVLANEPELGFVCRCLKYLCNYFLRCFSHSGGWLVNGLQTSLLLIGSDLAKMRV